MNRTRTVGLVVLALLSLADVPTPVVTDGDHPPMGVAVVSSVLGLVSLALVWYAARGSARAVAPLIGLRTLSALSAVPALFVDDVSTAMRVLVVAFVALTAVGAAMTLAPVALGQQATEATR